MKILLIKPDWAVHGVSPPLGLLYLSAIAKRQFPGIETRLLDMRVVKDGAARYDRLLRDWKPDIIGISTLNGDIEFVAALAGHARRVLPGVHICCGGPYATHAPGDFERIHAVDSLVLGEGENAFCHLVEQVANGRAEPHPGFAPRRGGGFMLPEENDVIDDLDALPFPDWDLLDFDLYARLPQMNSFLAGQRYMILFSSRACPYHCTYCHSIFGKKFRMRSPENVVREMELLRSSYGVDEFQIVDDIFNFDRERVLKICRLIGERGLDIKLSFPNGLRGDRLDEEVILALKRAGAYSITIAFETASPRLQKLLRKNIDLEHAAEAARISVRNGLITRGFFMLGFPTETRTEIQSTVRLAFSLPLHVASFFLVVPFKGTPLYDLAVQDVGPEKMALLKDQDYQAPSTYYMLSTGYNVRRLQRLCYLRLWMNPVRMMRLFKLMPHKLKRLRQLNAQLELLLDFHRGRGSAPQFSE